MRISDWSSDVCSSDLQCASNGRSFTPRIKSGANPVDSIARDSAIERGKQRSNAAMMRSAWAKDAAMAARSELSSRTDDRRRLARARSEEHTSELQSLMRISYAVFCLKQKTKQKD